MKTLEDICLANPLEMRIANVQFECTSDYNHFVGPIHTKFYNYLPLEKALKLWKHPLEFVEELEEVHKYDNDRLMHETATEIASQASATLCKLIPNIAELVYNGLKLQAKAEIIEGKTSKFVHAVIEHQTIRILQVYVPGYHETIAGQSINIEPKVLWENPNL